jgi:ELWxxDGT repeat protein
MGFVGRVSFGIALALCALAVVAASAEALPRAKVSLLRDINPGPVGSGPDRLVRLGDRVYFPAFSDEFGSELWRTDGTGNGTKLVADIVPGPKGSAPRGLYATDRYVFFTVMQPDFTRQLWRTDGTPAGTVRVPGTENFVDVVSAGAAGDLFFFDVQGGTATPGGTDLWVTDGESPPVEIGSRGGLIDAATFDGAVYLPMDGPAAGEVSLWRTDGTVAGTSAIARGFTSQGPQGVTPLGGALYFLGVDTGGSALWRTDGTAAGTTRVSDLPAAPNYAAPVAAIDGRLLLTLADAHTNQLWSTDGSTLGPLLLSRPFIGLEPEPDGGFAYLTAGSQLWRTDGTKAGTRVVSQRPKDPQGFAHAGPLTMFVAHGRGTRGTIWQTDGTSSGTVAVINKRHGDHLRSIASLTSLGSRVVFAAGTPRLGQELYVARLTR